MAAENEKLEYHGVNSLQKTELEQYEYYPDSSMHFVMDAVIDQEPRPKVRETNTSEPKVAPVKVILLRLTCNVRQYGNHKNSTGVDVWQMIVMDGAHNLFKIIINSRQSQDIPHEDLLPGSTIIIQPGDFRMIYMQDHDVSGYPRGLMAVDRFDWDPAPRYDCGDEARSTVTPEFCMCWLDRNAIDRVERESILMFMTSWQHEEGFFYFMAMNPKKVKEGKFAAFVPGRIADWNQKKRKIVPICKCQETPYVLDNCITNTVPIASIDSTELFLEVRAKLKGRVSAESFAGLSGSHKRWCYYWYYAVNFLHLGGGEATELPSCFVASVRQAFPDPNKNYTGFKSRETRDEESLEQM